MINRFVFILVSISVMPLLASAKGGDFIGNGGDAVWWNGRLVVRDLLQAGLEKNLWFGLPLDGYFEKGLGALPDFLNSAKRPLSHKLLDLNEAHPALGDMILASLKLYSFQRTEAPLKLLPAEGDLISYPEEARVQVAVRFSSTIFIHGPSWDKMEAAQQAALLIHEAVFSLLRPEALDDGVFRQSSLRTRELVGIFFSPDFPRRGPALIPNILREDFDIPAATGFGARSDPFWKISLYREDNEELMGSVFFNPAATAPELEAQLTGACFGLGLFKMEQSRAAKPRVFLRSRFELPPFRAKFVSYRSSFGPQQRVQIYRREPNVIEVDRIPLELDGHPILSCQTLLKNYAGPALEAQ